MLDEVTTTTGHPNFNALAYLPVHEMYLKDAKAVLLHYPRAYLRSCLIAWFAYFLPASDLHTFDGLRRTIRPFDRIFNSIFFGQFRQANSRKDLRALSASGHALSLVFYTGVFLILLLPLLVCFGLSQILSPALRSRLSRAQVVTLSFMIFNIVFVTLLSNMLSTFENNRYRFPLDGFYVALTGMFLQRIFECFGKKERGQASSVQVPTQESEKSRRQEDHH